MYVSTQTVFILFNYAIITSTSILIQFFRSSICQTPPVTCRLRRCAPDPVPFTVTISKIGDPMFGIATIIVDFGTTIHVFNVSTIMSAGRAAARKTTTVACSLYLYNSPRHIVTIIIIKTNLIYIHRY